MRRASPHIPGDSARRRSRGPSPKTRARGSRCRERLPGRAWPGYSTAMKTTLAFLAAVALAFAHAAQADTFPTRPLRLIVTYPPGGGADLMARLIAPKMSEVLGQPVVVENKAGA